MRILVVSQYYWPEQFQINEIAPELVRRGHDVTVVCGLPNYPKGVVYEGFEDSYKEPQVRDGVRIIRVNQKPRGKNVVSLIKNYSSFVKEANRVLDSLNENFDVVFGYQLSPVSSMLPAVKFAKRKGIPLLLYVLDIWPVSAESHLPLKRGLVYRWIKGLSKRVYRNANRILVTSRPFIDYLERVNGVARDRMGYLPQHADSSMLGMDLHKKSDGVTNFMFAGNLGAGATLEVIVKAAAILGPRNDYKVHFVGDGSCRRMLEEMVKEAGLERNFVFHGNQGREGMPDFYRLADALLLTLRGNNEVGDTMPGKLQMYMTTGKPVLGAINGAAREVIEESGCGRCVPAGDASGLANLMKDFMEHQERYALGGEKGRDFFKRNFTLDIFIDNLEKELSLK